MNSLYNELINVLKKNETYISEGKLLKNKIVEDALKLEPQLLRLLLSSNSIKKHFFQIVDELVVFDKIKFQKFVSNKQFLPDSYTSFKNKIGLTANGEYLTDSKEVVLAWPYKDFVLEGGQDKEDAKRNEIFWNETLAPDEIDRLLSPKVFTNWKKYDSDREHNLDSNIDFDKENLIIKGNNLLALHSLVERFRGKVKLIYIDPPYNTGNDSFNYNDRFNHSSWLTFMKNRLEIAKELLKKDGVIFIQCDDNEQAYLKVLMDIVFGKNNFFADFIWNHRKSSQNDIDISLSHNYTLAFSKFKNMFKLNPLKYDDSKFSNPDNDPKGNWTADPFDAPKIRKNLEYEIINPNTGESFYPPKGRHWRMTKEKYEKALAENRIIFGKSGKSKPQYKRYETEAAEKGVNPFTIWDDVGTATEATKELMKLFDDKIFATPKPEKLLQRIIHIATIENDLVLDFFSGSGTTMAVAHKMKRRYIGVEQMDYINTITVPRLQKVIGEKYQKDGEWIERIKCDEGGISKAVNWQGGGSFVYCELMKLNQMWIDKIQDAKTDKDLETIWQTMQEEAFISYKVDFSEFDKNVKEFSELSFEDKQKLLIETLDKNQLYVNYSEINDSDYKVSDEDKHLNSKFYKD